MCISVSHLGEDRCRSEPSTFRGSRVKVQSFQKKPICVAPGSAMRSGAEMGLGGKAGKDAWVGRFGTGRTQECERGHMLERRSGIVLQFKKDGAPLQRQEGAWSHTTSGHGRLDPPPFCGVKVSPPANHTGSCDLITFCTALPPKWCETQILRALGRGRHEKEAAHCAL